MTSVDSFASYLKQFVRPEPDQQAAPPPVRWSDDEPSRSASRGVPSDPRRLSRERALQQEVAHWQETWKDERRRNDKLIAEIAAREKETSVRDEKVGRGEGRKRQEERQGGEKDELGRRGRSLIRSLTCLPTCSLAPSLDSLACCCALLYRTHWLYLFPNPHPSPQARLAYEQQLHDLQQEVLLLQSQLAGQRQDADVKQRVLSGASLQVRGILNSITRAAMLSYHLTTTDPSTSPEQHHTSCHVLIPSHHHRPINKP